MMMGRGRKLEFIAICVVIIVSCLICYSAGFNPAVNYLINCGSSANTTVSNRVFMSDKLASRFLSTPNDVLANSSLNSSTKGSSAGSPLYSTARIFTQTSRFTFGIGKKGRIWIRLYLSPFQYGNYNMSKANFAVSAQNHVLFSNFTSKTTTVKEYSINVTSDTLVITFTPSVNSYAFLNGLEVVSVPDELITDDAQSANLSQKFQGLLTQALETVARINMGGPMITFANDTLWRTWVPDQSFLVQPNLAKSVSHIGAVNFQDGGPTPDIAPSSVYGSATELNSENDPRSNFNVTWSFNLESGFQYLLRFHFCDIVSSSLGQLYFDVYLDSWRVASNLDLSTITNSNLGAPYYMDIVSPRALTNKLRVSIGPSSLAGVYPNAILNGLEIMKMNNSEGSLSGGDVVLSPYKSRSKKSVGLIVGLILGAVIVTALLAGIWFLVCRRKREKTGGSKTWVGFSMGGGVKSHTMGSKYSNGASLGGYRFPFIAVSEATNGFDESWVIGVGGFGKVFKGTLSDGTKVAVKRGNPRSSQGLAEFQTEIEMLSQFRHRHLVSLIGYCDEKNEMILIYEYMENGTLKSHLYGSGLPSLEWKERLEICIGAARGLHYLHTGYAKAVIHRDVKSANILLDENLMSKVADFGLSKAGPEIDQTHVSTAVKGSFGYLDPEYFRRQRLTEKSDVYSFGVVLLEVLCARPVIDPSLAREMVNLAEWAMKWQKRGQLENIIDPNLAGKIKAGCLKKFGETAEKCLGEFGVERPPMGDVLFNLEYALQLQEAEAEGDGCNSDDHSNVIGELSCTDTATSVADLSGVSMSRVFSQLVKHEGR